MPKSFKASDVAGFAYVPQKKVRYPPSVRDKSMRTPMANTQKILILQLYFETLGTISTQKHIIFEAFPWQTLHPEQCVLPRQPRCADSTFDRSPLWLLES